MRRFHLNWMLTITDLWYGSQQYIWSYINTSHTYVYVVHPIPSIQASARSAYTNCSCGSWQYVRAILVERSCVRCAQFHGCDSHFNIIVWPMFFVPTHGVTYSHRFGLSFPRSRPQNYTSWNARSVSIHVWWWTHTERHDHHHSTNPTQNTIAIGLCIAIMPISSSLVFIYNTIMKSRVVWCLHGFFFLFLLLLCLTHLKPFALVALRLLVIDASCNRFFLTTTSKIDTLTHDRTLM